LLCNYIYIYTHTHTYTHTHINKFWHANVLQYKELHSKHVVSVMRAI